MQGTHWQYLMLFHLLDWSRTRRHSMLQSLRWICVRPASLSGLNAANVKLRASLV